MATQIPPRGKEEVVQPGAVQHKEKQPIPPKGSETIARAAGQVLQTTSPAEKMIPKKVVKIDEAALLKRWQEEGNWSKNEYEGLQKLAKNPKLGFTIWSSREAPTNWMVALSPTHIERTSKGLTDPVAAARAAAIRENHTIFVKEVSIKAAKESMFVLDSPTFLLRETSDKKNPNEFTLERHLPGEKKFLAYRILCTEKGYQFTDNEGKHTFTSLEGLLEKLGLQSTQSIYTSLYNSQEKTMSHVTIGYQNLDYLKSLEPYVQGIALDVVSDHVQSKSTMQALIFRLTQE